MRKSFPSSPKSESFPLLPSMVSSPPLPRRPPSLLQPLRLVLRLLLALAQRDNFLIIEEDVLGDLQHPSCTRLSALPHDDRVIYVASFSKTLSSALRVGYLSASAAIIAPPALHPRSWKQAISALCCS